MSRIADLLRQSVYWHQAGFALVSPRVRLRIVNGIVP